MFKTIHIYIYYIFTRNPCIFQVFHENTNKIRKKVDIPITFVYTLVKDTNSIGKK